MLKLSFFGGAREVTGVNYLLEDNLTKMLVDCGLFQGSRTAEDKNWEKFPYDPKDIDALFVTHGHLDHIGRIPKLVREGFKGKIFSTPPTRDFSELMLDDSLGILEKEAKRDKRKPFYSRNDIEKAMTLWETVSYDKEFSFAGAKIIFRDAGHILGSAMVEIIVSGKKLFFTGDLGNPPTPLLRDPYKLTATDYLVIESTYGGRRHEERNERKINLERIIEKTLNRGGVLMIPAYSIERAQELLFELNDLVEHGRIPKVPFFLDSPLSIKATAIYKKYESYFNAEAKYIIKSGDDVFKFPGLKFTLTTEESKAINDVSPPKIIIAGSSMSTGGRIIHHEKRYLPHSKNTLLIISYQAAGSLGRLLEEGNKLVNILGDEVLVEAEIASIKGYSAHPDTDALFKFIEMAEGIKKAFVVQGEPAESLFLAQRARDCLGVDAKVPNFGDSFILVK